MASLVVALQQQPHGLGLDRDAEVVDLAHVLLGELHHERSAPGPVADQALRAQQEQRVTDRAAAGLQLVGDLALHQPVAADQRSPGDQAADRVGCLHGQGLVLQRLQRVGGHRGPASAAAGAGMVGIAAGACPPDLMRAHSDRPPVAGTVWPDSATALSEASHTASPAISSALAIRPISVS